MNVLWHQRQEWPHGLVDNTCIEYIIYDIYLYNVINHFNYNYLWYNVIYDYNYIKCVDITGLSLLGSAPDPLCPRFGFWSGNMLLVLLLLRLLMIWEHIVIFLVLILEYILNVIVIVIVIDLGICHRYNYFVAVFLGLRIYLGPQRDLWDSLSQILWRSTLHTKRKK